MNRYQFLQQIGHGAYSIVFKAYDTITNSIVAIKRINHSNPEINKILSREIRTLNALQHPNIIRLLGLFNDHTYTYLVFEYLPCDLITYYKQVKKSQGRNLNDQEITFISFQMCQALAYMHQHGIMHRDIKPENVLIDPKTLRIKLIDFGFAIRINPYASNTQYMITRWYRPLQIVLTLPYDAKADIFALGALILQLYQGQEIFRSASNLDQLYWILEICGFPSGWSQALGRMQQLGISFDHKKLPQIYKMTKYLRQDAEKIIIGMLQPNPFYRLSINEVLNHPYFVKYQNPRPKKNAQEFKNFDRYQNVGLKQGEQNKNVNNIQRTVQNPHKNGGQRVHNPLTQNYSSYDLNLHLGRLSMRKQNTQLSTQRSKQIKFQQYTPPLSQRRMSEIDHFQNQRRDREPNRDKIYESNKINKVYQYGLRQDQREKKGRIRTQGNQGLISKNEEGIYLSGMGVKKESFSEKGNYQLKNNSYEQQYQNNLQAKSLKYRTKSHQGINIISLKRSNSKGYVMTGNPERQIDAQFYSNESENKKKQPSFTRIRDKFTLGVRPNGKQKMSLTDRNNMILQFGRNP